MTEILETKLAVALEKAIFQLKQESPYDTGNLRYNAIKLESLGGGEWKIYVDENIAPYMPYTNEKWTNKRWKGLKNPNEEWFDNAIKKILLLISAELGGRLERL